MMLSLHNSFHIKSFDRFSVLVGVFASILVTACGGGGGGSSTPATQLASSSVTLNITLSSGTVGTGQASTLTWSSSNATTCTASGAWGGSQATAGSTTVSQISSGTYNYALTCSGTSGSSTATAVLTVTGAAPNVAALRVDSGPGGNSINQPFVSVTICQPGTSTCQTIDHILVDTGSSGLRIIAPGVVSAGLALPAVTNASGKAIGECAQFVSGYMWGAVRRADVQIAGEIAASIPVHLIGDTGIPSVPSSCSSTGANFGTVFALGAKGILGVGLFNQDCGTACANFSIPGTYYACTSSCATTKMLLADQVSNPVVSFATDNNGVVISLPSVSHGGATSLTGSLIFGIGTQANNSIGGSQVAYKANTQGNFTTTYKGVSYTSSFLDSGSNGLFFPDSTIASSGAWFNPASMLSLSATNASWDHSTSGAVNFTIDPINSVTASTVAASVGGNSSYTFDWGLPFFFGRTVFVAIEGMSTSAGTGPLWAY